MDGMLIMPRRTVFMRTAYPNQIRSAVYHMAHSHGALAWHTSRWKHLIQKKFQYVAFNIHPQQLCDTPELRHEVIQGRKFACWRYSLYLYTFSMHLKWKSRLLLPVRSISVKINNLLVIYRLKPVWHGGLLKNHAEFLFWNLGRKSRVLGSAPVFQDAHAAS